MLTYIESLDGIEALAKRLNISPRMCVMLKAIDASHAFEDDDVERGARSKTLRPVLQPQTLAAFALCHGADAEEVALLNCFDEEARLYPGQTLMVPRADAELQ